MFTDRQTIRRIVVLVIAIMVVALAVAAVAVVLGATGVGVGAWALLSEPEAPPPPAPAGSRPPLNMSQPCRPERCARPRRQGRAATARVSQRTGT